ncbi:MAG: hypothetical protein D6712_15195 [Chloroflexi bacterium]|nr:MAG: hypothetical protein D6712_15195 [Chloroflexota bacterium]
MGLQLTDYYTAISEILPNVVSAPVHARFPATNPQLPYWSFFIEPQAPTYYGGSITRVLMTATCFLGRAKISTASAIDVLSQIDSDIESVFQYFKNNLSISSTSYPNGVQGFLYPVRLNDLRPGIQDVGGGQLAGAQFSLQWTHQVGG